MPSRKSLKKALNLAGLLVALGSAAPGFAETSESGSQKRLPCTSVSDELNFSNYWVGPSFEGLELNAVLRSCGADGRANSISYIYGDCTPQGGGCATPLEVQVWPASQRNKAMYEVPPDAPPGIPAMTGEDKTVNGVPAASYQGHFEVYYPDSTVVIFGDAAPKGYIAGFVVEGPTRLISLAEHGLYFDAECLHDVRGCQADRSRTSQSAERIGWIVSFWVLPLLVPFLAALFLGRLWLLLVPALLWPTIFRSLHGLVGNGCGGVLALRFALDADRRRGGRIGPCSSMAVHQGASIAATGEPVMFQVADVRRLLRVARCGCSHPGTSWRPSPR